MKKIRLSKEIMQKVNNNTLKTKELIEFILNNVTGTKTEKELNNTALQDVSFFGVYPTSANIDIWTNTLYIEF